MWWEDENNVSIHSEKELKGDPEGQLSIGSACIVRFGWHEYFGKIASVGKLNHT